MIGRLLYLIGGIFEYFDIPYRTCRYGRAPGLAKL